MSDFGKFVEAICRQLCKEIGINHDEAMEAWPRDYAMGLQRHYNQAGPWAEILKEAI
jgi:hypothetical protein